MGSHCACGRSQQVAPQQHTYAVVQACLLGAHMHACCAVETPHTARNRHAWTCTPIVVCSACRSVCAHSSSSSNSSVPGGAGNDDGSSTDASTSYSNVSLPWEAEQPAPPPNYASIQANIGHMDTNQLQTALGVAIAAEDYALASRCVNICRAPVGGQRRWCVLEQQSFNIHAEQSAVGLATTARSRSHKSCTSTALFCMQPHGSTSRQPSCHVFGSQPNAVTPRNANSLLTLPRPDPPMCACAHVPSFYMHTHTHSIKERLHTKLLESGSAVISKPMDWRALGVPEWLADRAERLGFLFPTGWSVGWLVGCCRCPVVCKSARSHHHTAKSC